MSNLTINPGTIRRLGNVYEGRLDRFLDHGPDKVWRMLTESDALARWLAPGTIELRKGGIVHLDFSDSGIVIDSTVREIEPPRLIEYSWSGPGDPQRPLRWELNHTKDGSYLMLTLQIPDKEDIARACGGFEAHLEMLAAALERVPIRFPADHFLEARRIYRGLRPE